MVDSNFSRSPHTGEFCSSSRNDDEIEDSRSDAVRRLKGGDEAQLQSTPVLAPIACICCNARIAVILLCVLVIITQMYYLVIVDEILVKTFTDNMLYRIINIVAALVGILGVLSHKSFLMGAISVVFLVVGLYSLFHCITRLILNVNRERKTVSLIVESIIFVVDMTITMFFFYCSYAARKLYKFHKTFEEKKWTTNQFNRKF
ncbi:unnamed protein product [Cylicocyclus nassatus]|uniref:Uncharacterized protein n=1 Tax=Cylicocyclus nassatus TaxID=53992 RepID=A0AA36DV69_CYLNA|nr:unnamed protein product [Cylicocyclus nassatus]